MSTDEEFQKNLELGEKAEDIVYDYLIRNHSSVLDLRKQKRDEGRGPRLLGTEGSFALPDFAVYNKNPTKGAFALDVKYKSSLYKFKGTDCFTVDSKFEKYKTVKQIMRLDNLYLVFFYNDRMHFYAESECIGRDFKSNDYGHGFVYYFEYDQSKVRY